ncbi:amidase [Burkholderia cepacia]|nr:amidase [Burkholderia cepacia]
MKLDEYENLDGIALAELIRSREVSALEVMKAAIRSAERSNPMLNAIVTPMYEFGIREAAKPLGDGRLAGLPMLVKDLLATVEGIPTSNGNRFWRSKSCIVDSELVRRFKNAGVIIFGKTNTPEFGLTPYTESKTLGPARNPWDLSRTTGGSSGGSAAAVAARITPIASGGDGGGSIRIPASACGIFGLKPTRARTPLGPSLGEAWKGFAIEHVLTRSVRDSALMLDLTHGPDVGAPYYAPPIQGSFLECVGRDPKSLRIAVTASPFLGKNVSPEVEAAYRETVSLLESLGHTVVDVAPAIDREQFSLDFVTILAGELRADLEETASAAGVSLKSSDFDPESFGLGMFGNALTAANYASASRRLFSAARDIGRFFEAYDILLTPTLAQLPVEIGALAPTAIERRLIDILAGTGGSWILKKLGLIRKLADTTFEFMPWTSVFNVTGQPAMSVPLCWDVTSGLPIGMHFAGRFGDEATLFSLAGQVERARPWQDRKPACSTYRPTGCER